MDDQSAEIFLAIRDLSWYLGASCIMSIQGGWDTHHHLRVMYNRPDPDTHQPATIHQDFNLDMPSDIERLINWVATVKFNFKSTSEAVFIDPESS